MKKQLVKILFLLFLFPQSVFSQYTMEWAHTFGGNGWDEANTCIETRDGEYILGGFAKLHEHQLWLVKVRPYGEGHWGKAFAEYFVSSCSSIAETLDSNIVLTGYAIRKREYQSNLLLMKLDTVGNVIWQKVYGGDGDEQGTKVIATTDGGYAIAGYSTSNNDAEPNWYIVKTDSNGNMLWDRQFGGSSDDRAVSIAETFDHGFVVTGYTGSGDGGRKMMSVIKLDSLGIDQWAQNYPVNDWSCGSDIIATKDSMIMVTGYTKAYTITDYDVLTIKTDMNGDTIWTRTFGDEHWQEGTSLVETFDNSFVVCGYSMSNIKDQSSFLILKYNKQGELIWHYTFKRKSQDYAKSVVETRDNGLLIAGTTYSFGKGWDMAALKMKSNDKKDILVKFPKDSLSTTLLNDVEIKLCVNGFGMPKLVNVYVNDIPQVSETTFPFFKEEDKNHGCELPLSFILNLSLGVNNIRIEILDSKNYTFERRISVYKFPRYDF